MEFNADRWQHFTTIQLIAMVNAKVKTLSKRKEPITVNDALSFARELVSVIEVLWVVSVRMSNRLSKVDPEGEAT